MQAFLPVLCALAIACGSARADGGDDDASLYRAFGEKPGLAALTVDFVGRLKVHPLIGHHFARGDAASLAEQLTDQFCQLAGGPCVYEGASMFKAHRDLGIRRADFNALVEVLQETMDARGIPFTMQNRMLARLAPLHRDIIAK